MACEKVLPVSFEETLTPPRSQWKINRVHGERLSLTCSRKKKQKKKQVLSWENLGCKAHFLISQFHGF